MGVDLLEIGVKMRRVVICTSRWCFRSICSHPFIVGMLCFLIFMYRLSPFMFSLLVSSSPVLVCTAVLLGTLLSFGEPNIPEIDVDDKTTHEVVSIKTGVLGDSIVIEKNESYYVERFSEKDDDVGDMEPLIEERSRESELDELRLKQKDEWLNDERLNDEGVVENYYAKVNDESGDEDSDGDSFDSETVNVDSLDSPPCSPWKRIEEREDEEEKGEQEDEEEEDDEDSESDRAESSSPDASMADIMPMLDELHPLLDEEAPQPVLLSHKSDEDIENHEDKNDNEDGEDEEEEEDRGEETKPAITWTEEDQKNLMDLGSSEIERNQRLESLILRRRARKNPGLIDLEISDRQFNIAPISTKRQNPFDLPNDSYDDLGLPPIPGSAPSILLARRNPFDIPYDSGEEKPNLMGDGFQEEFSTLQSRDPFFRRHESFNVRSSLFAPGRPAVRMRPYFVPEGSVSEESSYSPFRRQLSGLSDSKVSSVPETESIGSVEDVEERKFLEEDNREEMEDVEERKVLGEGNREEMEDLEERKLPQVEEGSSEDPSEDRKLIPDREEITKDVPQEQEPIFMMESVAELVRHGSESSSSSDEDSIEIGEVETEPVQVQLYNSNIESIEQGYSRGSSSSSLSVSERVFTEMEDDSLLIFEERQVVVPDEPVISTQTSVDTDSEERRDFVAEVLSAQTSVESADPSIISALVNDIPQREPVYDSSPRGLSKNLSSSSISSHVLAEIREEADMDTNFSGFDQKSESEGSLVAMVEENPIEPHILGEVLSSSEDKNIIESSEEQNQDQSQESLREVVEPAPESQLNTEDLIDMEEIVESPNPDVDFDEVQAKDAPADSSEDARTSDPLNVPNIQELDHDTPSTFDSPLSPDFFSVSSSETTTSHADVLKIVEETDEIKEMDEGLLLELDTVGDFGIKQWESGWSEFEKQVDSVGESFSSTYLVETSGMSIFEVQEIKTEDVENLREDMNIHEDEDDSISGNMLPEVELSSVKEVDSVKNDESTSTGMASHHGMLDLEASTIEDIDLAFKQVGANDIEKPIILELPQAELVVGDAIIEPLEDETPNENSNSTNETPLLEVRAVADTSLDFKQQSDDDSSESPKLSDLIEPKLNPDAFDKVGSSMEDSSVNETIAFAAENSNDEVETPKMLHSTTSGKGSESSSSESSSSDSDKE